MCAGRARRRSRRVCGRVEGKTGRAAVRAARSAERWAGFVLPEHARWYPKPAKGSMGTFAAMLRRAAGVDGRHTFHSWRHTWRTRMSEAGVSDEIAKRLGGWTRDATALRYDHDARSAELREAVERAAGAV
ncbi:MAG: hypothetical protein EOM72_13445 [Opitutae bacterium]|nr:hypothetical protein [Opitutae bacterium]